MTTYTTIFKGEVSPGTRPPTGRPLGPGRQPGFNPPPDKVRGPGRQRPPHTPGRYRPPFNPSRPFAPPLAPGDFDIPNPPKLPGKVPKYVRTIPGFARKAARVHPFFRALDLWLMLRDSGAVGWVGGEPTVVADWSRYDLTKANCPGIPQMRMGHHNGCYPAAPFPGLTDFTRKAPAAMDFSMWGQIDRGQGLLWYPAKGYPWKFNPALPKFGEPRFAPYEVPGLKAVSTVAFPPTPPQALRHAIGFKNHTKPPKPDSPVRTKRTKPDRKVKMSGWLKAGLLTALATTEMVDVVEALWDGMPDKIKKATPMTGVCNKGCRNPGTKYHSVWDKAQAIRKAWPTLDDKTIARMSVNLAANQIEDALYGRFFGKTDAARRRAGGTGWGFGMG